MPTKYLVVEIKNDSDLGKVVAALSSCSERLAVVDDVPGVFDGGKTTNSEGIKATPKSRIINSAKKRRCAPTDDAHIPDSDQITQIFNEEDFSEGLKENLQMALEASMLEEFVDAADTTFNEGLVRSLRKRGQREDGESALSVRRKITETTLVCGLCQSKMTLRASYGRTRLREHVMRHLNMNTAQCGHCDFQGVLREHVRRHYLLKHKEITPSIVELEPSEDYNVKFDNLWQVCFPTITQIQPRMTSQRARAHEAQYYCNIVKKDKNEELGPQNDSTMQDISTDKAFVSF